MSVSKNVKDDITFYIFIGTIALGFAAGIIYMLYSWLFA